MSLLLAALLATAALIGATTSSPDPRVAGTGHIQIPPDPRIGETVTELPGGRVLVAGGESLDGSRLTSAELYDPRSATWKPTGSMHVARFRHSATLLLDGTVFVAGGTRAGDQVSSPELYDPRTGTWTLVGHTGQRR
jgi:hypothetical protein